MVADALEFSSSVRERHLLKAIMCKLRSVEYRTKKTLCVQFKRAYLRSNIAEVDVQMSQWKDLTNQGIEISHGTD